ncbi:hypothetical protein [Roseisolibacter agri]|uniref:hypothetical protein n=1 Tax=Roseisolibacter agri TaxID=2014610 RepID=UPI0024E0B16C|nr:hypothetical protein [Roseisolibacter agri]
MGAAFWISRRRDSYHFASAAERAAWRWSAPPVAFVCLLMAMEALLVWVVLVGGGGWPLWKRALAGSAMLVPWTMLSAIFVLHGTGYIAWHVLWLCGLLAVLLVSALGSLAMAARRWMRRCS